MFASPGTEPRGHLPLWKVLQEKRPESCVEVTQQDPEQFRVKPGSSSERWISLRDDEALAKLVASADLYLDVSGLAHHVWAPTLRVALKTARTLKVLYAEPSSYKPHPSPASPTLFDLSTGFRGLSPLPGFAQLRGPIEDGKSLFVAFLGFEGTRPQHLALSLDPVPKVIPVIGVPGFRIEYPTFTVACNRDFIAEHRAAAEIRLARASCPFDAYRVLTGIRDDYPGYYLYVAPVGTKPHAVGAIKYALDNPDYTEIMYDHPERKPFRTSGVGVVHVYTLK